MPTVLFWGTGALAAAVQCLKYLGTSHETPTCRLRVALQDFFEPRESEATTKQPDTRS